MHQPTGQTPSMLSCWGGPFHKMGFTKRYLERHLTGSLIQDGGVIYLYPQDGQGKHLYRLRTLMERPDGPWMAAYHVQPDATFTEHEQPPKVNAPG